MLVPFLAGAATGAGFGVVLYKVGATRYSRVMGMLTLRDTKVMKFAFTTIGVASLAYGLAAAAGVAEAWNLVPRVMPFLGGAHLLGGALFGLGMGVSGLCPGTCVAKAGGRGGAKKYATPAAMLGLVAGVLLYAWLKDPLTASGVIAENQKPLTLHGVLGLPYAAVALALGAAMVLVALAVDRLTPERFYAPAQERRTVLDWLRGEWSWTVAGTVAGLLIVASTAQGGYLGFSGAILAAVGGAANLAGAPMEIVSEGERGHRLARRAHRRRLPGRLARPPLLDPVEGRRGSTGAEGPRFQGHRDELRRRDGDVPRRPRGRRLHHRRVPLGVADAVHRQLRDGGHLLRRLDDDVERATDAPPHRRPRRRAAGRRPRLRLGAHEDPGPHPRPADHRGARRRMGGAP